jgi:hypothetical protein
MVPYQLTCSYGPITAVSCDFSDIRRVRHRCQRMTFHLLTSRIPHFLNLEQVHFSAILWRELGPMPDYSLSWTPRPPRDIVDRGPCTALISYVRFLERIVWYRVTRLCELDQPRSVGCPVPGSDVLYRNSGGSSSCQAPTQRKTTISPTSALCFMMLHHIPPSSKSRWWKYSVPNAGIRQGLCFHRDLVL